jgi:hypothetical protein
MKATILTTEEIRNCDGRNYNPQIWNENIDRMSKYNDVVFYYVANGDGYDYDRYFVEYTLPEGVRLFKSFGYSSSLTSGGFYRLDKVQITNDGRTYSDIHKLYTEGASKEEMAQLIKELNETKTFIILASKFNLQGTDEQVVIGTTPEARKWMIEKSTKYGITFTKGI